MTSQHNIEPILEKFFPLGLINHFFNPFYFCEIGCWSGQNISQTFYLEQVRGWVGIAVDPFPKDFKGRTCQLVVAAISKDGLPREFIKVSIDRRNGGDVSYFSGFVDSVKTHWTVIRDHCEYEIVMINTITFERLCEVYRVPDYVEFLSVDTEGAELEIFQSIDFSKHEFGLICFEHNGFKFAKSEIGKILSEAGYVLYKELSEDDIYINKNLNQTL